MTLKSLAISDLYIYRSWTGESNATHNMHAAASQHCSDSFVKEKYYLSQRTWCSISPWRFIFVNGLYSLWNPSPSTKVAWTSFKSGANNNMLKMLSYFYEEPLVFCSAVCFTLSCHIFLKTKCYNCFRTQVGHVVGDIMGLILCSFFPHWSWKKTYRFLLSQARINSLFTRKTGVAAYRNPNIALINLLMKSIAPHHAWANYSRGGNFRVFSRPKK